MSTDTSVHAKICALRADLANTLLERDAAIDAAILALITREHALFLGPPGTAKSMLVRAICERIDGASYFERLCTRFSVPEEIFGPLSLSALEQDRYERVTAGTLVEAHIGFVDEVFKANSAILNSLLTLVNERLYHESGRARPVPLLSLFGASNELPEDASLAALHDRFLLRVTVPYLADDDSMRRLFDLAPVAPSAKITLDDLRAAQAEVNTVPLTDAAREAIIAVKHALEAEGITVSDRRWRQCGTLIKARAWLDGDATANEEHGAVLVHSLWTTPDQIRVVERCVARVASPLDLESVELEDAAKDLYDQRPEPDATDLTQRLEPLLRQLSDIHTRLDTRIAGSPEKRTLRARQAMAKITRWHRDLSGLALRSLSRLHMAPGAA
jgi:MoxR-like ATPase